MRVLAGLMIPWLFVGIAGAQSAPSVVAAPKYDYTYIQDGGEPNIGKNGNVDEYSDVWRTVLDDGWVLKAASGSGSSALYVFERPNAMPATARPKYDYTYIQDAGEPNIGTGGDIKYSDVWANVLNAGWVLRTTTGSGSSALYIFERQRNVPSIARIEPSDKFDYTYIQDGGEPNIGKGGEIKYSALWSSVAQSGWVLKSTSGSGAAALYVFERKRSESPN